jgi:hypothetical protein
MLSFYEDMPECSDFKSEMNGIHSDSPPLTGGARGGSIKINTPTFVLPVCTDRGQGGGDCDDARTFGRRA